MRVLLGMSFALAAAIASAGQVDPLKQGKKNAAQVFSDLHEPQFRKLKLRYSSNGKPAMLCGEINGKNRPEFIKFWVPINLDSRDYRRPADFPQRIWDELVDAVCATEL